MNLRLDTAWMSATSGARRHHGVVIPSRRLPSMTDRRELGCRRKCRGGRGRRLWDRSRPCFTTGAAGDRFEQRKSPLSETRHHRVEVIELAGLDPSPLDELVDVLASEPQYTPLPGPAGRHEDVRSEFAPVDEVVGRVDGDAEKLGRRRDADVVVVGQPSHGRIVRRPPSRARTMGPDSGVIP